MPLLHTAMLEDKHGTLLAGLLVVVTLALVGTSHQHLLSCSGVAWLFILAFTWRKGAFETAVEPQTRALSWTAGSLMALANVCERTVEQGHLWWAKVRSEFLFPEHLLYFFLTCKMSWLKGITACNRSRPARKQYLRERRNNKSQV